MYICWQNKVYLNKASLKELYFIINTVYFHTAVTTNCNGKILVTQDSNLVLPQSSSDALRAPDMLMEMDYYYFVFCKAFVVRSL